MRPTLTTLCLLTIILALLNPRASAQNYLYGTGSPTWGVNIPIENGFINVANGEVHIEIPIASLPQRGSLPLQEKLVYDSRIWQIISTGSSFSFEPTNVPTPYSGVNPTCTGNPPAACTSNTPGTITLTQLNVPNSMAGWRFVAGSEVGILQEYLSGNLTNLSASSTYNFGWTDPSGTLHYFPITTGTVWCPTCGPESASGYAMDGSGYYMAVTNYTTAIIYDANGNEVYPQVVDRNGNNFSTNSNGNLVDTIGRTPVTTSTSGNTTYYSVLTIGGATKQYKVTTETINVHTAFGQSGTNDYSGTLTAISSISLPDGSSYSFTYDSGTASGNYGELESVTLPTGGVVSFGYQNYLDSYQNQNRWLESYSGGNGSYTFTPQVVTQCQGASEVDCQEQMTVQDGNQNKVSYLLTLNNGAWNSQINYYNVGSSSPFLSKAITYNFSNSAPSWFGSGSEWITASNSTTTLNDTGQTAQTQYTYLYPWSGKPSTIKEWNYYTGGPSPVPTKETDITYGYWVNDAYYPTQINKLDSNGNLATQVVLNYDGAELSTATGATNLAAAPGGYVRGNLTSIQLGGYTSVNSGLGSANTTSYSNYDTAGMKVTDADGNSNQTTYSYNCSDAYLGTTTLPVVVGGSHLLSQAVTDCSSGLVTSTKDPNGVVNNLATTYTYFTSGTNIGRLENVASPDGGSTTYAYPSEIETDQTVAQTSTANVTTKSILDSFGRRYQSVRVAPEGNISSEITYDPAGHPSCATNPHLQGTTSPTDGTTCTYVDVIGRSIKTAFPDGNVITTSYSGPTKTVTDELSNSKQYTYDAFQRLIKVLEPNSSGALSYETDYQYNVLDNLTEVDQWGAASGSTSPGDRQRLFAYDILGREIAERIPENQSVVSPAAQTCSGTTSGTKWTECIAYDANSNATSTTDNAGNVLTYQYDGLNRMTRETSSNGSINYYYYYDYYNYNPSGTNTIGRLSGATNDVNAAEFFNYDSMGRLKEQVNWIPQNQGFNTPVSASYDLAGDMTSLTYPDGRALQQSFDEAARLTGVTYAAWGSNPVGTSYIATSKFAPPGQPTASTLGNGVSIAAAYNSRQNVTQMSYSNSSGTALWSKNFIWDYNAQNLMFEGDRITGNVRQFTYDTLNRLTSAEDFTSNGYSTATVSISGSEQEYSFNPCTSPAPPCPQYIYDGGGENISINGVLTGFGWGQTATPSSLASSLASSINSNSSLNTLVSATASGSSVVLTSKIAGPEGDFRIKESSISWNTSFFSSPSFTASFPATLSGAGTPLSGGLNESYSYDPFGNLTDSGSYGFSQSFNGFNQVNGYSYDADGDQNTDIYGHTLAFDPNGMLSSVAGGQETYSYDALGNRVEVLHGSTATDTIYFGGVPVALLSSGAYLDLVSQGGTLFAEVNGTSQNNLPTYRATDNLGTLGGSLTSGGALVNPMNYAPYGEQFSGTTSDLFGFTGMQWDPTTATNHATARQFSIQQSRWQSPDPYSDSYNWADPQSLNRYAYVNGRPMAFTDPSGREGVFYPAIWAVPVDLVASAAAIIIDALFTDLDQHFHGSLAKRPGANPWSDKFGVPYGGIGNSIGQAFGLPTGGCDFGACGAGPMSVTGRQGDPGPNPISATSGAISGSFVLPLLFGVLGPAGSFSYDPKNHLVCGGGGVGLSAGHTIGGGGVVVHAKPGQTSEDVLGGWSLSGGYNWTPWWGVQGSVNGSGYTVGQSFGVPGASGTITYSWCGHVGG
jgi:RHS repeat-associated protein